MILIWVAQGRGEFTGVVCERMRGGLGVELEGNAARALYVEDEPESLFRRENGLVFSTRGFWTNSQRILPRGP